MQAPPDSKIAPPLTASFHTLGCKLNHAETSSLAQRFSRAGFEVREHDGPSDVVVINSCTVTENADRECRQLVRRALRTNPAAFVVVTGCYAQLQPETIASIDGVDLVVGSADKHRLLEIETTFRKRDVPRIQVSEPQGDDFGPGVSIPLMGQTRAYLKVQDGCDYSCSFCTIPRARGASRSQSIAESVAQAQTLIAQGFQEIILTGVNLGDYGRKRGESLVDLLRALEDLPAMPRLRLSSIEPNLIDDALITLVSSSSHIVPHFHIPLQSGSDAVLSAMRRRYRSDAYRGTVERIVERVPDAAIGVDVIVGFPGEGERDFLETVTFLRDLPIAYLHVFTYSERENTPATGLPGTVPIGDRRQRTRLLRALSDRKMSQFVSRFEHTSRPVLFEQEKGEVIEGYTDNYIRVRVPNQPGFAGTVRSIRIGEFDGRAARGIESLDAVAS